MKIKYLAAPLAAMVVGLFSSQAFAVNAGWGRADLSYLNYDCIGGSCRIAGNIKDLDSSDTHCVKLQVYQQYGSGEYQRTCTGTTINYDFYLPASWGAVNLVLLVREGTSNSAIVWQR